MGCQCFKSDSDDKEIARSKTQLTQTISVKMSLENSVINETEESESCHLEDNCYVCKCQFENPDEKIDLRCLKCKICKACISNIFEETLNSDENLPLISQCKVPIPYNLFIDDVLDESLVCYIEKISKLSYKLPSKFICSCGALHKLPNDSTYFSECKECRKKQCLRCFQPHNSSLICIEYFRLTYKICNLCKIEDAITTSCDCRICKKCLVREIKEQISDDPLVPPSCPLCSSEVPQDELHDLFVSKNKFILMQEDFLLQSRFDCPICYKSKVVDGSITLYCKHRFCRKCIQNHLKNGLTNLQGDSTDISCPLCAQPINYFIIDDNLFGNYKERYQLKLLKNTKINKELEVMKFCNVCSYAEMIPINQPEFNCRKCNKTICPKCNKIIVQCSCQVVRGESNLGDMAAFIIKCPKCNCGVMKEAGCNFIKCMWPDCQGVYFCFLCKKMLTAEDHFKHYKVTGPFGMSCNTLDNIKEE